MSNSRSPRAVRSMTIGTRGMGERNSRWPSAARGGLQPVRERAHRRPQLPGSADAERAVEAGEDAGHVVERLDPHAQQYAAAGLLAQLAEGRRDVPARVRQVGLE